MSELRHVSLSPHIHAPTDTKTLMRCVLLSLLPAGVFGVWSFGWRALAVIALCAAVCVLTEFLYEKLMKLPVTVGDCSAAVTGVLLAYTLPATVPLWMAALGSVFAVLIVKMLFGGLGQNFMNPALAARCFLLISFGGALTSYPAGVDGVTGATPLAVVKAGETVDLLTMLLGTHGGCIGEVSAAAILIGGIYLCVRRVIAPRIPLVYIGSFVLSVTVISLLRGSGLPTGAFQLTQVCGGGLLLGAVFMATDYVTSPVTRGGQWVYAAFIGILTAVFRLLGSTAEGVSYAIVLGNILVPLIERMTMPKPFGVKKERAA